jgi:hypothetical protein
MDFYNELIESEKFCKNLGKLILTSGKLESILKEITQAHNKSQNLEYATLGKLVSLCKSNQLIDDGVLEALDFIKTRRNYLTHSLFPLFNEEVDITLLPRDNLEPEDAEYYFSKCVSELIEDMNFVIDTLGV